MKNQVFDFLYNISNYVTIEQQLQTNLGHKIETTFTIQKK